MSQKRWNRLVDLIHNAGFAAIALNPGPSLTYLTGLHFHLMERPTVLLFAPGAKPAIILPELELGKLGEIDTRLSSFSYGDNPANWQVAFNQATRALGLEGKRIGLEPNRMRFLELHFLQTAAPQAEFVSGDNVFASLRLCKDVQEIDFMRKAVAIAQQALRNTLPSFRPGVEERELASELTIQLLRAGSDPEMPFSPIIASGPNSANPHAGPSGRKLQFGDLVVVDWGAYYQGYCSDLTRTFAIGAIDPEFTRIYELVQRGNAAGCAAVHPGAVAGEIDKAARQVIDKGGYGAQFFHRTGHGLGMEGHEPPYIYDENNLVLEAGMTFTIEPGIYLNGRGGIRIEDNVAVTLQGVEVLSNLPRELQVL